MVTATLVPPAVHPAARRRIAATLPAEPAHDVTLRPVGGGGLREMIVSVTDPDFLPTLFEDLKADDWRTRLAARRGVRRGKSDGMLELGLPTHRHFQLVVFELVCRMPGFPRLDPAKIDSMGLVLRRWNRRLGLTGWRKAGSQSLGWKPIGHEELLDPEPARRDIGTGPAATLAAILATKRGAGSVPTEETFPLFVAPPDVCDARRRTIVYGIVPVSSSDQVATDDVPDFTALEASEAKAVVDHLSEFLKARAPTSMPRAGQPLDGKWKVLQPQGDGSVEAARTNVFGVFLQQLKSELGAYEAGDAPRALMDELATIGLVLARDDKGRVSRQTDAASFARAASAILLDGEANANNATTMPVEWPRIEDAQGQRLTRLAQACLTARFRQVIAETPKFDRDEAVYTVRGFVRVRGHAQCAPKLVWSDDYSEKFRILPWWDSDAPAARISLPGIANLRALKPNISFELPPALANLLQGDMKKLATGDGSPPSEFGIGWICSFSIPIITLCAFIVLSIFLSLFDIVFFWMAFLKICIPYPKKTG